MQTPQPILALATVMSFSCLLANDQPLDHDVQPLFCEPEMRASSCCGDDRCDSNENAHSCPQDCALCGDGLCSFGETGSNCPADCPVCGDGTCEAGESPQTCSADCVGTCGDGVCVASETVTSCAQDCGLARTVRLDKVRHCRSNLFCNSTTSYPEYNAWDHHNVSKGKQKRTFIAKASDPAKSRVKHLVFVSAGQQVAPLIDNDRLSSLTGQLGTYKNDFGKRDKSKMVPTFHSLARRLFEDMSWRVDESFVGLAFDARFHYLFDQFAKADIVDAYYEWLESKFDPNIVESIYLAGHSRGGCLVGRLASRFAVDYPDIPLIVHVFDGVCYPDEFGQVRQTVPNPLNSNYYAYDVNLWLKFGDYPNVAFFNMVSGAQVVGDILGELAVHGFSQSGASSPEWQLGRIRQKWYDATHNEIEGWGDAQMDALEHLATSCATLGCD